MKSIYRRFTDQIAADAARAALSNPRRNAFAWLEGDWVWCGRPVRFSSVPFGVALAPSGEPFLIHNAAADMWLLVLLDPTSFGILIGTEVKNGAATFTGDVNIDGTSVRLREVWRQIDDSTVEIANHRYVEGTWQLWERDLLERVKPSN